MRRLHKVKNKTIVFLFLFLLIIAGLTLFYSRQRNNSNFRNQSEHVKVLYVIDGDTIDVSINGKRERVRLIGIDAPEIENSNLPVDTLPQCFAQEAQKRLEELLADTIITLEPDATQDNRDKYNRLLRYVVLPDAANVNQQLIREGFAREYTYLGKEYQYYEQFNQIEKEAKEKELGIWSKDSCLPAGRASGSQ